MTLRTTNSTNNLHTELDFITTDYNHTADNVLVILDHSLAVRVTIPYAVDIQFDLLRMSIILIEIGRGL
jgi:hypothetical protein